MKVRHHTILPGIYSIIGVLILGLFGCAAPESSSETTPVSLRIPAMSSETLKLKMFSPIPSGINTLRIDVSGDNLESISDDITVTPGEPFTWTRLIQNGINRIFTITAGSSKRKDDICIGQSEAVDLFGQAVTLEITMLGCSHTLTVDIAGGGSGSVTSNPPGIECAGDCTEQFNNGETIGLIATPDAGSFFAGLSGHPDCADSSLTMRSNITCTAIFELITSESFTLIVDIAGGGSGSVTSNPPGIDCGVDCTEQFKNGEIVGLIATPNSGSIFAGLSGHPDCADSSLTMTSDITCTATFELVMAAGAAVTAGEGHSCTWTTAGTIQCWGDNRFGQIGNGTTDDSLIPSAVSNITNITDVSSGRRHTCAVSSGIIYCWGDNDFGQLGDGSRSRSLIPVPVSGITNATNISSGKRHSCAIVDGSVKCWGDNGFGQLGNGSHTDSSTPITVSGITNATNISSGKRHTCVILDGLVQCWGSNEFGQLGDGTTVDSSTPQTVSGISGATQISAGGRHSCARISTGTVKCWGLNGSGQLGIGPGDSFSSEPRTVLGIDNALKVSLGFDHSCALLSGGTLSCWGGNLFGQLGDGTGSSTPVFLPFPVSGGIATATDIASGWFHSCAGLADGRVKCWGKNRFGQLGDGSMDGIDIPVTVIGLP